MAPLFGFFSFGKKKDDQKPPPTPTDPGKAESGEGAPDTSRDSSRIARRRPSFEMIVKRKNLISEANIDEAKKIKRKRLADSEKCVMLIDLGNILIEMALVSEADHAKLYSSEFRIPFVKLSNYAIKTDVVSLIDPEVARKYWVFPIDKIGRTVTLAMFSPATHIIDSIAEETELKFKEVVSTRTEIINCINKYYGAAEDESPQPEEESDEDLKHATQSTVRVSPDRIQDEQPGDQAAEKGAEDPQEQSDKPEPEEAYKDWKETTALKSDSQRRKQTVRLFINDDDILSTDDPGVVESDPKKDTNRIVVEDSGDLVDGSGDRAALSRSDAAVGLRASGTGGDIDFTDPMGEDAPLIVETGRELVAASVSEQEFSIATSGKSMDERFNDWVGKKRPSQVSAQPVSSELFNLYVGRKI